MRTAFALALVLVFIAAVVSAAIEADVSARESSLSEPNGTCLLQLNSSFFCASLTLGL
jgi:hypothetical protein